MRIADLDSTRGDDYPRWTKITTPVAACIAPNSNAGCYSSNFSTLSVYYSRICGMAVDYQKNYCNAFAGFSVDGYLINGPYVDGISISYSSPRKHIWTYAKGLGDRSNTPVFNCPCAQYPGPLPPSFVHDNYYCESGTMLNSKGIFIDDPVWDSEGCSNENGCCSDPNQPWFYRQIPLTASDDIETQICCDSPPDDEDVLIAEFKLYVQ